MQLTDDAYYDIPRGKLASVGTFLEMTERPAARGGPERADLALRHDLRPDLGRYRDLFRRVGEPWLWFTRLMLDDAALAVILHDPRFELHALLRDGREIGILELDLREPGQCELAFFGLVPEAVGSGAGRWLMQRAIDLAWRPGIGRFWVHTCNLDHPMALAFYRRSGFVPYKYAIDLGPDPRAIGVLPRDAAPQFPLID